MLLSEQAPREPATAHVRGGELPAPRAVVVPLVQPEQHGVERAAQRQRIAEVVRCLEPAIRAELQLTTTVASRHEEVAVELRVSLAVPRYESRSIALTKLLRHAQTGRESFDPVVSR